MFFEMPHTKEKDVLRREHLRALAEARVQKPALEEVPEYFEHKSDREHAFRKLERSFLHSFNERRLMRCLDEEPSELNMKYMDTLRMHAIMLNNGYKFFDESHQRPQLLRDFSHYLGLFKDYYRLPERREAPEHVLRALSLQWDELRRLPYEVADRKSFHHECAKELYEEVRFTLDQKELFADDYHQLRRMARRFSNLLQVPAAEHPGGAAHWLCRELFKLSDMMDTYHKRIEEPVLKEVGEKDAKETEEEYQNTVMKLSKEVREKWEELFPYLEVATGLKRFRDEETMPLAA